MAPKSTWTHFKIFFRLNNKISYSLLWQIYKASSPQAHTGIINHINSEQVQQPEIVQKLLYRVFTAPQLVFT